MKTISETIYSPGKNDECYTPAYGVTPILKYIPKDAVVWCPFDTEESQFVKQIGRTNKVIHTHISRGQDFLTYQPEERWDCIVSNPPFTGKRQIFERALALGKPFALIMTNTWLNDAAPKQIFMRKQLQLLLFVERMKFENCEQRGIPFSSSYYCHDFLPRDLIIESFDSQGQSLF